MGWRGWWWKEGKDIVMGDNVGGEGREKVKKGSGLKEIGWN